MPFEVNSLGDRFAAEIVGIDLARRLSDDDFAAIRAAWFDAGVVVFRDQHFSPAQHVAFSRRFGDLIVHVMHQFLLPGHPEILLISNRKHPDGTPMGFEDAGRYWHSDISYDERPALGSHLHAVEIPPEGGDTLFADMRHALKTLPDDLRRRIEGRRARHSYTRNHRKNETVAGGRPAFSAEQRDKLRDVTHPMVRTVEDTGEEALFVNPGFTFAVEEMDEAESDALLAALFEHSTREAFLYTHRWRPGDLLCWDNRSVMHRATLYDPAATRHMHRTTIAGVRPV
ncbi:MAG: TauD/TfdA family dioxygenase [Defluviicoccus sp.]|nr:TauD/TfdA family dioxygenase [Defluviicoccus sp.]